MIDKNANDEIETIINSSPAIIFLWKAEADWPVEFVSENILQFGYDADEFLNGDFKYTDIVHPDDVKKLDEDFSRYMGKNQHKGFKRQYRIITKFGETRWVDERSLIRRDNDGKITHFQGIIFDITENKKNEEILQLNEARLETLLKLNQMSAASVQEIIDFALEEGIKLTKSKVGYLALLNSSEDILTMYSWSQRAMSEYSEDNKRFYCLEDTGLWGEAIRRREAVITNDYDLSPLNKGHPMGNVKLARHMNVPVCDGNKIVALVGVGNKESYYDETDVKQLKLLIEGMWKLIHRKELEDALKQFSREFEKANNELKSINSIKKEFLTDKEHLFLSDDEKFVDRETLDSLNEQQNRAVEIAIRNSEKLKNIVDWLLYTNMEQGGKIEYEPSETNILHVIDNAILNVILQVDEKNITIKKNVPDDMSLINVDKEKLIDAFTRVIKSSVHFTPQNGSINIGVFEDDKYVDFEIKDSGTGIPEPFVSNLFIRFYQTQDSEIYPTLDRVYDELKSNFYICKNIVEAHEGKICVKNEEGAGTVIHVRLPKKRSEFEIEQKLN